MKIGFLHGLPAAQRSMLRALAHRFNDATGLCFPSIRSLADEEGIKNKGAVRHTINKLIAAGRIERSDVFGRPGFRFPAAVEAVIFQYGFALRDGLEFRIKTAYAAELESAEARQGDAGGGQGDAHARQGDAGGGSSRRGGRVNMTRVTEVTTTDKKNATGSMNSLADQSSQNGSHEIDRKPPEPRPVLVPAAAVSDPSTAEAVFNTLEIPKKEPDMLTLREKEIRTIFHDGLENGRHLDDDRRGDLRRELFDIAQKKRLKKEEANDGIEIDFTTEEEHAHDRSQTETVQRMQAEQGPQRILQEQVAERRPAVQVQDVLQRL